MHVIARTLLEVYCVYYLKVCALMAVISRTPSRALVQLCNSEEGGYYTYSSSIIMILRARLGDNVLSVSISMRIEYLSLPAKPALWIDHLSSETI